MRSLLPVLVLALLIAAPGALAQASGAVQVSAVSVSPQPVQPGSDFTLTISFYNPAGNGVSGFVTELAVPSAFTLKAQTNGLVTGGTLCGYCSTDSTYFVHVSPEAVSGTYRFQAKAKLPAFESVKNIDVEVRGKPNLVLDTATPGLDQLQPNQAFDLALEVRNVGTGPAFEVSVEPMSTAIIALGSGIRTIATIDRNASGSVLVPLVVSATTKPGAYQLPFTITYKDVAGVENKTNRTLGVRVVEAGELAVQNVKVADPKGGSLRAGPAVVIVRVENTGFGDAEAVRAVLACPFNGETTAFLGRLKPDEDSPAVFDFANVPAGEHACTLTLRYKDDLGEHVQQQEIAIAAGAQDLSGIVVPIVIIVVLGVVFRKRLLRLVRGAKAK